MRLQRLNAREQHRQEQPEGNIGLNATSRNRGEEAWEALAPFLYEVQPNKLNGNVLQDEACAICLSDLEPSEEQEGEPLLGLPCKHVFHAKCIRRWIYQQAALSNCPLCKSQIDLEQQMMLGAPAELPSSSWRRPPTPARAEASVGLSASEMVMTGSPALEANREAATEALHR